MSTAAPQQPTTDDAVVSLTAGALAQITELLAAEPDGDTLGLRIAITGVSGDEFAYELTFDPLEEAAADDVVRHQDGLPVVVPADSVSRLRGATLDVPAQAGQAGLVLRNPNRPNPFTASGREASDLNLEGTVEERVRQLLDTEINPSLASHGGFAELVAVDGEEVHLSMGGGCQGCGLAKVTLTMGIEGAIIDAIPEVARVVDVTDHAAGENPFYEAAK
jgi:Fe/S biogenesis protein NfuA